MKKIISTLIIVMLVSLLITSCTTQLKETPSEITDSIEEADNLDSELNSEELDTDLDNLEADLSNW